MSKYHISRRLQFIIQYINDEKHVSKEHILDFLNDKDFNVSARTLERDFEKIKSDFGIELSYDKQQNGYYIDEEKSVKVSSFFKFLELITLADVFADGLKNSHKILDYVSFDNFNSLKGIDNLEYILIAIKQGRKLEFTHYNYFKETYKKYVITPVIIKEYVNRWYVIGVPDELSEIRTFGIDRMFDTVVGKTSKISKTKYLKQLSRFKNIIGLNYSDKQPEHILLKTTNEHVKYLESLPLHHSQKITESDQKGFYNVSYFLIPNYEFTVEVLKMSIETEVLEPAWYRGYFKKEIANIHEKYKD